MPDSKRGYHAVLRKFMSWNDGIDYEKTRRFTQEELLTITPQLIVRWFKWRVYGSPDADPYTDPIQAHRSNSVKAWKKSLSYFMPNNNMQWVETQNLGNPTKSRDIAKFLKTIMKKEAARLGMPSQARRAIHVAEFEQAIETLKSEVAEAQLQVERSGEELK